MGKRIAGYYAEAEALGGLEAKIKLATLTRVPSTRALIDEDTPDLLNRFEGAMGELRRVFSRPASSAPRDGKSVTSSPPRRTLPEGEDLLWGMLSSLHDATFMLFDSEAHCAWAWESKSFVRRFAGLAESRAAGASGDFIAAIIVERFGREIRKVFATAEGGQHELALHHEGELFWVSVSLSAIHDDKGKVTAAAAFVQDITDRKASEALLRAREERLRTHNRVFLDLVAHKSLFLGDVEKTIQRVTEAATDTLDVARASVWFFDPTKTSIVCADLHDGMARTHASGVALSSADFPDYFQALMQERTIAARNAHTDPRTCAFSAPYLTPLGINAMLDVPIWVNGEMVGVVCHEHIGGPREWTPDEENFAYLMANFVALARERAEI
jgi:PAS domain-containing protein